MKELAIYQNEGLAGAIVADYHGSLKDIVDTLDAIENEGSTIPIGVNLLDGEVELSFKFVRDYEEVQFVQFDHVAGTYKLGMFDEKEFWQHKAGIPVLGGVWPEGHTPVKGSKLDEDLRLGITRAEAIVVTGKERGGETPEDKIRYFRKVIGNHPLLVGAGITPENAYEKLSITDGAIVGRAFKPERDTRKPVDKYLVRDLMDAVKELV